MTIICESSSAVAVHINSCCDVTSVLDSSLDPSPSPILEPSSIVRGRFSPFHRPFSLNRENSAAGLE